MPNRMLRDWTNSDKVENISFQAEVFFTRLIMKADDYGCFWADPKRLKANLFPLKSDSIREADMFRWMTECQKAGLIVIYESDQKKYLQILEFGQRLRTKKSKFPKPDIKLTATCGQMTADCPPEEEVEVEGRKEQHPPPDLGIVVYDAEETILNNQIQLERICVVAGVKLDSAKESLHKYHLHLEEKEQYPKGKKAVFAGFEKWLRNERNFKPKEEKTFATTSNSAPLKKINV